ncbi:MAG TPA: response regulator, partial [Labilithrix sp.]|nr:response regulator [Labilithrix sp.]
MTKKVLVVDDSRTVRQQVGGSLVDAGYEVVEAGDGLEALEWVAKASDLAMVICDVNMPRMNGLEFLNRLKSEGRFPALPVLMLTTEGRVAPIAQARATGAKGWMVK